MAGLKAALARRSLERIATVIRPQSWEISVREGIEEYRIDARLRFAYSSLTAGTAAYVDFGRWPLGFRELSLATGLRLSTKAGTLAIPLRSTRVKEEECDELLIDFDWPKGENALGHLLSIPAQLPTPIHPLKGPSEFPLASVRIAKMPPSLPISIFSPLGQVQADGLTGVVANVIPTSEVGEISSRDDCILVSTKALCHKISLPTREALERDILSCLTYLTGLLGAPHPTSILVADETALFHDRGRDLPGVVLIDDELLGKATSFETIYEIGRQLAVLWWDGMCKVHGTYGQDIVEAIKSAIGLTAASFLSSDTDRLALARGRLQAMARHSSFRDSWDFAHGQGRSGIIGRNALSLLAQGNHLETLRSVLHEFAGKSVRDTEVMPLLGLGSIRPINFFVRAR